MKNLLLSLILSMSVVSASELPNDELMDLVGTIGEVEIETDESKYVDVVSYYYSRVYTKPLVDRKSANQYFTGYYNKHHGTD